MLTSTLKIVKLKVIPNPVAAAEAIATFTSICISSGVNVGVSTGVSSRVSSCRVGMVHSARNTVSARPIFVILLSGRHITTQ